MWAATADLSGLSDLGLDSRWPGSSSMTHIVEAGQSISILRDSARRRFGLIC